MATIETYDVYITDIKYETSSNSLSLLVDKPQNVSCQSIFHLEEKNDDIAPFFICYYLEENLDYYIIKALKVFTVFVEREGILHLRKYDNLIRKIKAIVNNQTKKQILYAESSDEVNNDKIATLLYEAGIEYRMYSLIKDTLTRKDGEILVSCHSIDSDYEFCQKPKGKIFSIDGRDIGSITPAVPRKNSKTSDSQVSSHAHWCLYFLIPASLIVVIALALHIYRNGYAPQRPYAH